MDEVRVSAVGLGDEVEAEDALSQSQTQTQTQTQTQSAGAGRGVLLSRMPLVLGSSTHHSKPCVLVQGSDAQLDVSGDVGTIGRLNVDAERRNVVLDLKGTVYAGRVLPAATALVVGFDASEARVLNVVNDHVWLTPGRSVFTSESVVQGVLDAAFFRDTDVDVNTREAKVSSAAAAAAASQTGSSKGKRSAAASPRKRGRASNAAGSGARASKKARGAASQGSG